MEDDLLFAAVVCGQISDQAVVTAIARLVAQLFHPAVTAEDAIEMVYSINANKRKERMTNG